MGSSLPGYPIAAVPAARVRLTDEFWNPRLETNRSVTLPFGFSKCEEEGRLRNFERAAGLRSDPYEGQMPFDDTDVYKLIEGASYSLKAHPDEELERVVDHAILEIAAAMEPDGYLTTYKTIDVAMSPAPWAPAGPRWEMMLQGSHELYNSGHLYEAADAHYKTTGKRSLLDVALQNAELLLDTFGPGKRLTPPGHPVVEMGLVKLAELSGDRRFIDLSRFFLEQRGNAAGHELAGPEIQDHLPVLLQNEAVGHAVRAMYMVSGMVDIAAVAGHARYLQAACALWDDIVQSKLYVTGGLGARHEGEAFGSAFELPNSTAYAETCAAIGSVYLNQRLFRLTGDSRYVDVLERTLYNALIVGVSLRGDAFFYPNVLEWDGKTPFNRGATGRQPWFDCSCCPTNVARFLPTVPELVYATRGRRVFVNLFVSGRAAFEVDGTTLTLVQSTEYPWDGRIELRVAPSEPRELELSFRIPGWARGKPVPSELYRYVDELDMTDEPVLSVNGERIVPSLEQGYAVVTRQWREGDTVSLDLPMRVRRVVADERVAADRGKVAIERGPVVYCAEAVDNDGSVLDLVIPDAAPLEPVEQASLLGGVVALEGPVVSQSGRTRRFFAVPYHVWAHRGAGEMAVWLQRARRASA